MLEIELNKEKTNKEYNTFILSWTIIISLGFFTVYTKNIIPVVMYFLLAMVYYIKRWLSNNNNN